MMRIGLLLATNFAVLMVAGVIMSLLGLDQGSTMGMLFFCAVFGFGGSFVSLLMSKSMAKRGSGTQIIETPANETEQWLHDRIAAHAKASNIGMPEVGIFASPQPNAFATGWNKNKSLVAVSAGLLNNFPREEVDAVLAHEIGHVANGDMITLTLIQGITNTFVLFFARMAAMVIAGAARNRAMGTIGYHLTTWVFQAIFGILASMIVMWFSRRREFRADEAGARLTSPHAMASALERLKHPVSPHPALPERMAAFGISSNFKSKLGGLLATHPSLDDRIAALRARQ
ncbi:MAG: protease HtpX [Acidimicrobiales bacterium]|nr:protease HtpX [Hyphomonadaceae bacterium]RZV44808.1 MAG: protease HtpX [Acidimicrobiales bacterium]